MRTKALGLKLVAALASIPIKGGGSLKASISPPPTAAPAIRNVLRESSAVAPEMPSGPSRSKIMSTSLNRSGLSLGRLLDGLTNTEIRAAAADVARHRSIDVIVGRIGVAGEQRRGGHDLTRLAIAALDHLEIEPGFLNFLSGWSVADCFDSRDFRILHALNGGDTGAGRETIHMNCAGTAERLTTTELCARHAEHI